MALEPVMPTAARTPPMHPEVVSDRPGDCPICGMALERRVASAEPEEDGELVDMTRRSGRSRPRASRLRARDGRDDSGRSARARVLRLVLPVVLWGGWPFFGGARSLQSGHLNMFTLIALGTGVAWAFSTLALLAPDLFPAAFRGHHGQVAVYFEAAAVIVTLVLLGQVLELRARSATGAAIRALLGLAPKTARRIEPTGEEIDVPLEAVRVGNGCACGRARRCPSTGASSTDGARSTNR